MVPVTARGDDLSGAIALAEENGAPLLRLIGEVDYAVVTAYEEEGGHDADPEPSVIDASEVTFLDCSALEFLIDRTAAARSDGRTPVLRRPPRIVRRLLSAAGAEDLFRTAA